VATEIVETERSYVQSLKNCIQFYYNPLIAAVDKQTRSFAKEKKRRQTGLNAVDSAKSNIKEYYDDRVGKKERKRKKKRKKKKETEKEKEKERKRKKQTNTTQNTQNRKQDQCHNPNQ